MSADVIVKLDRKGVYAAMQEPWAQAAVLEGAYRVASSLPAGEYRVCGNEGHKRAVAYVQCATDEAMQRNLDSNELLKALGANCID